jgi:hypothetical protein
MKKIILALVLAASTVSIANAGSYYGSGGTYLGHSTYEGNGVTSFYNSNGRYVGHVWE